MSKPKQVHRAILVLVTVAVGLGCLRLLWMGEWEKLLTIGSGGLWLILLENWERYEEDDD